MAIKKRDMHSSFLYIRVYKNKRNINSISSVSGSKINNRITNLLKSIKIKKSFSIDFLISKASLIFIPLWKIFNKTLILYYFDLKYHIPIKINTLHYVISRI